MKTKKEVNWDYDICKMEEDLIEARRKHKDLDNRSYLLGYYDAIKELGEVLSKVKKIMKVIK